MKPTYTKHIFNLPYSPNKLINNNYTYGQYPRMLYHQSKNIKNCGSTVWPVIKSCCGRFVMMWKTYYITKPRYFALVSSFFGITIMYIDVVWFGAFNNMTWGRLSCFDYLDYALYGTLLGLVFPFTVCGAIVMSPIIIRDILISKYTYNDDEHNE